MRISFLKNRIGSDSKNPLSNHLCSISEVGPDPEYQSRFQKDSAFLFWTRIRTRIQKFGEKTDPDPESLFNFDSNRSMCGHFLSKTWVNYAWINDCNRSLNRSRILKFEKIPDSDLDLDSKILEEERSRSLKK